MRSNRRCAPDLASFRLLDAGAISVDELNAPGGKPARWHSLRRIIFMKNSVLIIATSLVIAPFALAADTGLKDQKDKVSYAIGLDIGTTMKRQMIDVNDELLNAGIKDGLSGAKPRMTDEEVKEVMSTFQKDMMAKQAAARKAAGEKNAAEGKKFLDENKTKDGVKTTASGLQYKVLKEGTGTPPKATDTVKVNYRGTTIDGKEFDSSYKRGEPATFPVDRVIKGWTEGLQLMKPGSKYQFFVPPDLAYGERGAGADIGPNSTLLFEIELLEVVPPGATPPAKPAVVPKKPNAATAPATGASPKKP
jgi:FKBP-type peptidyl-prolyl cis-trans isomerase FklB